MSLSEVMTIAVTQCLAFGETAFHGSGYKTFKEFYTLQVQPHWNQAFPSLVSYNRFVELMPWCMMLLCCFLQTRKGEVTGISFIMLRALYSVLPLSYQLFNLPNLIPVNRCNPNFLVF
jgi:hypothetical protein